MGFSNHPLPCLPDRLCPVTSERELTVDSVIFTLRMNPTFCQCLIRRVTELPDLGSDTLCGFPPSNMTSLIDINSIGVSFCFDDHLSFSLACLIVHAICCVKKTRSTNRMKSLFRKSLDSSRKIRYSPIDTSEMRVTSFVEVRLDCVLREEWSFGVSRGRWWWWSSNSISISSRAFNFRRCTSNAIGFAILSKLFLF